MREKILKIADRLIKRAEEYQAPFATLEDFVGSQSYWISTTLREVAYQIRAELEDK